MTSIEYNDYLICSMKPFTQIRRHNDIITSIDYSYTSNTILTGGNDDLISMYSVQEGKTIIEIFNNFYGVKYVCLTSEENKILCAGKYDNRIMIIDIAKKTIDFSFFGHNKQIDSLIFSHETGLFISNSFEEQISIIWNYKSKKCYCIIKSSLNACFDYFGDIFASLSIQHNNGTTLSQCLKVNLYKINNDTLIFPPASFNSINIESKTVDQIRISNNGEYIICFSKRELSIYDLNKGDCIASHKNDDLDYKSFDLTPESKYIAVIDNNDKLWYFKLTGEEVKKEKLINQKCEVIKFFNGYALMAIASDHLVLYAPDINS